MTKIYQKIDYSLVVRILYRIKHEKALNSNANSMRMETTVLKKTVSYHTKIVFAQYLEKCDNFKLRKPKEI